MSEFYKDNPVRQASPVQPRPPLASNLAQGLAQQSSNQSGAYPPPYEDDAPSPQPSPAYAAADPAPPLAAATLFHHLDTQYLKNAQKALRSNIPSDPTWSAHVGALIRALIQHALDDPQRQKTDQEALDASQRAREQKVADDMAARHEAEKAAIAGPDGSVNSKEAQELEARHQQEVAQHDRQRRLSELAIQQAQDRAEFDQHQAEQRNAIVNEADPNAPPPEDARYHVGPPTDARVY